jgi:UDPglucose 6-dehydrogenase
VVKKLYRISILGTGYVGLCTAVCFADKGYNVLTSTYNEKNIRLINSGIPPFFEPQLEEMLKRVIQSGKLKAVYGRETAVLESDISFLTVGTPSQEDGAIDLKFIRSSSQEVGEALQRKSDYHLVVVKSTVVPGTTGKVVKPLLEKYAKRKVGTEIGLAMSPEFLRQGSSIYDTLNPDRIVIGEYDEQSGNTLSQLYQDFYEEKIPSVLRMSLASAEMIKYANNAFLATKISFINEISNICERIGNSNIDIIAKGIGLDFRINPRFLKAGPGWGGSCFPKDVKALIAFSKQLENEPILLNAVTEVNKKQAEHVVSIVRKELKELRGKTIAILGLSFKPNTSDTRESPAFKIINHLLKDHATIKVYDPQAMENTRKQYHEKIGFSKNAIECITDTDCCILVTDWNEFQKINPKDFQLKMNTPLLIDTKRLYNPNEYSKGITYRAIGIR